MRHPRSKIGSHRALRLEALEDRRVLAVTFEFNFQTGSGNIGFNDPVEGAARQAALERAGAELGALFDHTATIEVDVASSNGGGLAAASARFGTPPIDGGFFAGIPQQKILNGGDPNAAASDASMTVFFGNTLWHTGAGPVPTGAYDLVAIAKHELLHTLGFASGISRDGSDEWGNALGAAGSIWDPFDEFVADRDGNRLIDPSTFQIDVDSWSTNSTGGTSPGAGLFFNGPNAMAANGGQLVGLFSPTSWLQGSSVSHLDTNNSGFSDQTHLMIHAFRTGTVTREPHAIEIGILTDLGYDMDLDGGTDPPVDAGFTVTPGTTNVAEGGQVTFTVVLDSAPTTDVVMTIVSNDETETSVTPSSVTFTPANWNTPQVVTVTGVVDGLDDGDQTSDITVSVDDAASDDAFDGLADQTITITTLDAVAPGFTITPVDSTTVSESGTSIEFLIQLTTQPASNVTLNLTDEDPTEIALSGLTFEFTPQNWDTPQTLTVSGVADGLIDGNQDTNITGSVDDSASDPAFHDVADETVTVTTFDINVPGFLITPFGPGTVSETGTSVDYFVQLTAMPTSNVVLDITNGDASEVTVGVSSLEFTPENWDTPQLLRVSGLSDGIEDGDQTTDITVSVNRPDSDDAFDNLPSQFVRITTIDVAGFAGFVLSSQQDLIVSESGTQASFGITLEAQPSAPVSVVIGADDNSEAQLSAATLTFNSENWNTPQTVTVTGLDDAFVDGDQTTTLTLSIGAGSDPLFIGVPQQTLRVQTLDDDTASFTVSAPTSHTISEVGATTFSVTLDAVPDSDVVINIASSDAAAATVSIEQLVFTNSTWNLPRFVTVSGVSDGIVGGDRTVTITVSVDPANSVSSYGSLPAQTLALLITNADVFATSDFGDAGGTFPTTLADNGARHTGIGPTLGTARDIESDANTDPTHGDDGDNIDDEDGISVNPVFMGQSTFEIMIVASNVTDRAMLDAWVDFDGDGSWQLDEQIAVSVSLSEGSNSLSVSLPGDAVLGSRQARFRISSAGGLAPTGQAMDGEVEDHLIDFVNSDWFNANEPLNVDGLNGPTPTPFDALAVVNDLTANVYSDPVTFELPSNPSVPVFIDVDNNGRVNPLDALLVINGLLANAARKATVPVQTPDDEAPVFQPIISQPSLGTTTGLELVGLESEVKSDSQFRQRSRSSWFSSRGNATHEQSKGEQEQETALTDYCFAELFGDWPAHECSNG